MRVKARNFVWGVRQMNCSEIPDAWKKMAVKRFSRVQSMPMWTRASTLDRGSPWIMTCIVNSSCIQGSRWTSVNAHRDGNNCNTSKILKLLRSERITCQHTAFEESEAVVICFSSHCWRKQSIYRTQIMSLFSIKILKIHHAQLFYELKSLQLQ